MYQYAELVHWMKQDQLAIIPASVDIDITNHCNQDCFYCESSEFRKTSLTSQTFESYTTLIDRLGSWRSHTPNSMGTLHTICFSGGGEPTLFKGYEKLIELGINSGFRTSIITNGVNLEKLLTIQCDKMAWVGVDLDAANKETYELIRKSNGKSIYEKVIDNITHLVQAGVNIDIKILLNQYNCTEKELHKIFELAKSTKVRSLYFRPTVMHGIAYDYRPYSEFIQNLSTQYGVQIKMNLKKFEPRTYSRCHQMYQFAIFCPDGNLYTCCENKGNAKFSIGNWVNHDFRDLWISAQHRNIYNSINTKLCPPCRSHDHNLAVQSIIDNPDLLDKLYY